MTVEPAITGGDLPDRARVVIIGGGVIGTSTAYHLARLGWTDVLLLEQGQLSCGTTWHAAGLLGQLRATESGTRLVQYSARLYGELEAETGLATGLKRCGGVTVARTPERMVQLRRTAATAEAYDLECELLAPRQALERYPILETGDLLGALWLPGDAHRQPRRRDGLARPRRAPPGRPYRGAHPGHRRRHSGRPGDGRRDGPGRRRGRGRRELRRPMGEGRRPPLRRGRPAPLGRALLRGDRANRGGPPAAPHPARPRRVHLREGGGRRARRRRLRADGQALGRPRRAAVPVRVPTARGGLGPLQHSHGISRSPDSRSRDDRAEEAVQRPRELHARQPVHPGRGAERPGVLRGGGVQLGRDRVGWRRRAGPSPSGSSKASRRATWSPSTSGGSRRSTRTTGGCGTASARSSASTTPCRGRTGSWRPPARSGDRRCTTSWRAREPSSARRWGGSGPTSSHRPGCPPNSTTRGAGPGGSPGRPPSRRRPGSGRPSSTRRPSASSSWSVGTRRRCSSACARRMWASDRAGPSTRACSTSAPATRPT